MNMEVQTIRHPAYGTKKKEKPLRALDVNYYSSRKFRLSQLLLDMEALGADKNQIEAITNSLNYRGVSNAFGLRKNFIRLNITYKLVVKELLNSIVRQKAKMCECFVYPSDVEKAFGQEEGHGKQIFKDYRAYIHMRMELLQMRQALKDLEFAREDIKKCLESYAFEWFTTKTNKNK
jgi:hypothetical protein